MATSGESDDKIFLFNNNGHPMLFGKNTLTKKTSLIKKIKTKISSIK